LAGDHERESPRKGELKSQKNSQSKEQAKPQQESTANSPRLSHEQLVKEFRNYIQERDQLFRVHGVHSSPEVIIRAKLYEEIMKFGPHTSFWFPVRNAWDALAYDRYEPGSFDERQAGGTLEYYYRSTNEPAIKLFDPQIRIIDALTEAVSIPRERGQAEIEIPEKLRNYTK
jgi:hypothetical protein